MKLSLTPFLLLTAAAETYGIGLRRSGKGFSVRRWPRSFKAEKRQTALEYLRALAHCLEELEQLRQLGATH